MTSLVPSFMALKKEGDSGRKTLNQYTRYGTVFLTAVQGYGIAVGLESWGAGQGVSAVIDPGMFFRVTTVITLIGGTMFLMWLGEQITSRGIGNPHIVWRAGNCKEARLFGVLPAWRVIQDARVGQRNPHL